MTDNNLAKYLVQEPLLIVISGPSGVGKDAVIKGMKDRQVEFHFVVTATTRAPRPGEVEGKDYIFVSSGHFAEMINRNELLEYAVVYNDFKGVPKEQVRLALESGKDVIMRVDVQGAARIRELIPDTLLIFLTTQDEDELVKRLESRHTDTTTDRALRIASARQEFKRIPEYDYIVVNRDGELDGAIDTILAIITAEHHRVEQRKVSL
ncbi:MAG TPA: guanylate kinase [Anaerolineales bacterium]|nr:guanylate kinase [Anaerolineales bacterium]